MFEGSTLGNYKFYCEGFTFHFDKVFELEAYVAWLKTKGSLKAGSEYKIWDKRRMSSAPAKTGFIS